MSAREAWGWCPSVLTPMPADDGLLVRVKATAAQLSASQLATLAEAAAREGNGIVQLTSRANLQLRGFTPTSAERFARVAIDLGLAASGSAAEAVRNVQSAPLAGADPSAVDVRPYAVALESLLLAEPALHALPAKFGFAVDGGGVARLPRDADVLIDVTSAWAKVSLPNAACAHRTAPTPAAVVEAVRPLLAEFLTRRAKRMRHLLAAESAEALFDSAKLSTEAFVQPEPRPLPAGYTAYDENLGCFLADFPEGVTDTNSLLALAETAERYGQGRLATTPWRGLVLPAVADADALARDWSPLELPA